MKVLHLMAEGNQIGGIETMMADYAKYSKNENIFLFAWGDGIAADKIRKNGGKVISFDGKKNGNIRLIAYVLFQVKKYKIEKIVIHHESPQLRLIGILLSIFHPVFVYHHCNAYDQNIARGVKRKAIDFINILSVRTARKNIAISKSVKNSVHNLFGVCYRSIKVIYNGIDISKFEPTKQKEDDPIRLIYVGRLIKVKGVQVIIKALKILTEKQKYIFYIVGDGDYRKKLECMAKEYKLEKNVVFLGFRNDVSSILRNCHIFVNTPIWEEGFGNTVVEAMASGLVCVCSESGGIKEIISDKTNGFLVKKNNPRQLCSVLYELINSENSFLNKISNASIKRAKKFNVENYSLRMDRLLREYI